MKAKVIGALAGTLLLAAFLFSGVSIKATSLSELSAKADASGGCTPNSSTDCQSSATGNIYIGYEYFSF